MYADIIPCFINNSNVLNFNGIPGTTSRAITTSSAFLGINYGRDWFRHQIGWSSFLEKINGYAG